MLDSVFSEQRGEKVDGCWELIYREKAVLYVFLMLPSEMKNTSFCLSHDSIFIWKREGRCERMFKADRVP